LHALHVEVGTGRPPPQTPPSAVRPLALFIAPSAPPPPTSSTPKLLSSTRSPPDTARRGRTSEPVDATGRVGMTTMWPSHSAGVESDAAPVGMAGADGAAACQPCLGRGGSARRRHRHGHGPGCSPRPDPSRPTRGGNALQVLPPTPARRCSSSGGPSRLTNSSIRAARTPRRARGNAGSERALLPTRQQARMMADGTPRPMRQRGGGP
jgi:hypothetical protein